MNDFSARRRFAGFSLIAAAAVALPLTASISYAEQPVAPDAPDAPAAPAAPEAPTAPEAPIAPQSPEVDRQIERHVIVIKDEDGEGDGKEVRKVRKMIFRGTDGATLSREEMDRIMAEVERGLAEADEAIGKAHEAHRIAIARVGEGAGRPVTVTMSCEDGDGVSEVDSRDGKRIVKICKSQIMASAVEGLREARQELEAEQDIPRDMLDRILKALDEKIAKWENDNG